MKSDVLELLVYLFEHYMDDEGERLPDEEGLRDELQQAGFRLHDIRKAFAWLGDLADRPEALGSTATDSALRHYDDSELVRLDSSCRGFLLFLEHNGVLNPVSRERVIDRLMALEGDLISIEHPSNTSSGWCCWCSSASLARRPRSPGCTSWSTRATRPANTSTELFPGFARETRFLAGLGHC